MRTTHREFKDRLYGQFARLGKALSNPYRLEILELLAQGQRSVESFATELELYVHYRLADPEVFQLSKVIRSVAERRLAELERLVNEHFTSRLDAEPVPMPELLKRARSKQVVILDTRPASEYFAGHIPGALSMPVDDLQRRLKKLTTSKEYVAYCRGPYCIYADRAVEMLRAAGRRARRLADGFPEWRSAGLPVSEGAQPGALR
jgi:rhodanese-related sulfurtransferase